MAKPKKQPETTNMMEWMGLTPPPPPPGGGGGGGGGSDDDIIQNNLTSGVTYSLSNSQYDRDITYRDRTGALQYIEPGDSRYDKAREKLTPALKSELAMRQDSYLEGLAEEGKDQAMFAYADAELQSDPETYDPYGESYTDIGLEEQRAYERDDVGKTQDYFTKERDRLSAEVEVARTELEASVDAQKRFERGESDPKTLQDRLLLGQRQKALRQKEIESLQATGSVLPEEYLDSPSKAKQTIAGYLSELTEEKIPKLEKEAAILEETLKDPSIWMPEQAAASGTLPGTRASRELKRRRRRDDLQEQLQKKKDELLGARIDANKYRHQTGLLGETLPIREGEERSRLVRPIVERDMFGTGRSRNEGGGVSDESSSRSVDPSNTGLPIQSGDREITGESYHLSDLEDPETGIRDFTHVRPLTDAEYKRMYPEQYEAVTSVPPPIDEDEEDEAALRTSFGPTIRSPDTGKKDGTVSTTDTANPTGRTR